MDKKPEVGTEVIYTDPSPECGLVAEAEVIPPTLSGFPYPHDEVDIRITKVTQEGSFAPGEYHFGAGDTLTANISWLEPQG